MWSHSPAAAPHTILTVLTALVVSACGASTPAPVWATAPEPGLILFQAETDDRIEVATVRTDGTGLSFPLAEVTGGHQTNPDWSPDGSHITFVMPDETGDDDLWVSRIDGSGARRLLECAAPCLWIDDPAWSPDGRRIVFSRTVAAGRTGVSTLESVMVRTARTRVLLGPWTRSFTAGARWSPDGARLVFERVRKTGPQVEADISGVTLTLMRLDRTHHPLREITEPEAWAATADWSPNGRSLVYSALAEPGAATPDLFVRPAGRGEATRLTDLATTGGYAAEPTFSRDSTSVVFSGTTGPDAAPLLWRIEIDGSGLTLATGEPGVAGRHPRVRPTPTDR